MPLLSTIIRRRVNIRQSEYPRRCIHPTAPVCPSTNTALDTHTATPSSLGLASEASLVFGPANCR